MQTGDCDDPWPWHTSAAELQNRAISVHWAQDTVCKVSLQARCGTILWKSCQSRTRSLLYSFAALSEAPRHILVTAWNRDLSTPDENRLIPRLTPMLVFSIFRHLQTSTGRSLDKNTSIFWNWKSTGTYWQPAQHKRIGPLQEYSQFGLTFAS